MLLSTVDELLSRTSSCRQRLPVAPIVRTGDRSAGALQWWDTGCHPPEGSKAATRSKPQQRSDAISRHNQA